MESYTRIIQHYTNCTLDEAEEVESRMRAKFMSSIEWQTPRQFETAAQAIYNQMVEEEYGLIESEV